MDNVENQFLQSPKGATHNITNPNNSWSTNGDHPVGTVQKCHDLLRESNTFKKDQ